MRALIRLFGILALVFASAAGAADEVAVPPLEASVTDLKARPMGAAAGQAIYFVHKLLIRLMPFRGERRMPAYRPALWPYTLNFTYQDYQLEG